MSKAFDIADITYIKRVIVGNDNPERMIDEGYIEQQMDFVNRCLREFPKGKNNRAGKGFLHSAHRRASGYY